MHYTKRGKSLAQVWKLDIQTVTLLWCAFMKAHSLCPFLPLMWCFPYSVIFLLQNCRFCRGLWLRLVKVFRCLGGGYWTAFVSEQGLMMIWIYWFFCPAVHDKGFVICSASFISNFSWLFISLWLSRVTIRVRTLLHYALYYHNKKRPSKNMTQFCF